MKIMGVDPGISGALAFLSIPSMDLTVHDMPVLTTRTSTKKNQSWVNATLLTEIIEAERPTFAMVERVNAMPGQGVVSMFRFGYSFGLVMGVIGALRIPHDTMTPQEWRKTLKIPTSPDDASRLSAIRWFPSSASNFKRKCDHNRAEAALIALATHFRP